MRVLQVLPRYAPAWSYGGGVRMFWMLACELTRLGHEVRVVTSDSINPETRASELNETLDGGIQVTRYRNRFNSLSARAGALFFRPSGMRTGIRRLAEWSDVIHMGESRGIHNLWAAQAAGSTGVPLIWSAYGGLPPARGVRGVYRKVYDVAFTGSVIPNVGRFVAQTDHEAGVYIAHGASPSKVRLIPLCVDIHDFVTPPERGRFRDRIGVGANDLLVVCVGRLSPVKGMDLLVDAFAKVPAQPKGPYLALVGWDHGAEATLRDQVKRLNLERRVFFPGALLGDDRMLAYVDADVFALTPAVYEETSLAALEASALGIPTVLTHECEIPSMAEAGGGVVVNRSEENVAAALSRLFEDSPARAAMGARAREVVFEQFGVNTIARRHETVFEEVARTSAVRG